MPGSGQSKAASHVTSAHEIGAFHLRNRAGLLDEIVRVWRRRCAMTPRMTPDDRSSRVSARVSMSEMADDALRHEVVAQACRPRASCSRSATPIA